MISAVICPEGNKSVCQRQCCVQSVLLLIGLGVWCLFDNDGNNNDGRHDTKANEFIRKNICFVSPFTKCRFYLLSALQTLLGSSCPLLQTGMTSTLVQGLHNTSNYLRHLKARSYKGSLLLTSGRRCVTDCLWYQAQVFFGCVFSPKKQARPLVNHDERELSSFLFSFTRWGCIQSVWEMHHAYASWCIHVKMVFFTPANTSQSKFVTRRTYTHKTPDFFSQGQRRLKLNFQTVSAVVHNV